MGTLTTAQPVALGASQVASLNAQIAKLDQGEPYLAVLANGQVFVRSIRGVPETLVQLWRKHPAMMVPDAAGYRPAVRRVDAEDL